MINLLPKTLLQKKSPIEELKKLKTKYHGSEPIMDLTEGMPNYFPDKTLIKYFVNEIEQKETALYSERGGFKELKTLLAFNYSKCYQARINKENILITSGCNNAFAILVLTLFKEGDEVLLLSPYYFNHRMFLEMEGIMIKYIDTTKNNMVDVSVVHKLITKKTRAIILTNPVNPTGYIIPNKVLLDLYYFCAENNIFLVIDETYKSFIFNQSTPHDLFKIKSWANNFISLQSLSKDYALCGYRIGAIISKNQVLQEMLKVSECISVSPSTIGQKVAIISLKLGEKEKCKNIKYITNKGNYFKAAMRNLNENFQLVSHGVFFGWVKHNFNTPTEKVVSQLILSMGVLVLPGNLFVPNKNRFIRISYSTLNYKEIDELVIRLNSLKITN
ncbi:MAG: aminotransferase class I/II-fold pyridoxal phosphate-dependent enzyme [Chitinophagales bacterium]|nr:aminotransferase class I/II-fold pyridoxal phosphate-dependent enzyme [Chitinophagales bacterium]